MNGGGQTRNKQGRQGDKLTETAIVSLSDEKHGEDNPDVDSSSAFVSARDRLGETSALFKLIHASWCFCTTSPHMNTVC